MFCPKCGGLLRPKEGSRTEFMCPNPKCGFEQKAAEVAKSAPSKIRTEMKKREVEDCPVVGTAESIMPTTDACCPKCSHGKAYWYLRQTRKSDEPETTFLTCCKCGHKWRKY